MFKDTIALSKSDDLGFSATGNLWWLGSFMLLYPCKDLRIRATKEKDHHFLANLLDLCYTVKMPKLILPSQWKQQMRHLLEALHKNL